MKKTSKISIAIIVLIATAIITTACSNGGNGNTNETLPQTHVYVLMGQSNMVGAFEEVTGREVNDRITFLDLTNELQIVGSSLHSEESDYWDIQNGNYPIGIGFADEIIKKYSKKDTVMLVTCARGASSIDEQLYRNQFNGLTGFHKPSLIELCEERISDALTYDNAVLEGVLYYQGESDFTKPEYWGEKMEELVSELKEQFGEFPFVFAQLANFTMDMRDGVQEKWGNFQRYQGYFSQMTGFPMVETKDQVLSDGIHLTLEGDLEVGKRFAEKF